MCLLIFSIVQDIDKLKVHTRSGSVIRSTIEVPEHAEKISKAGIPVAAAVDESCRRLVVASSNKSIHIWSLEDLCIVAERYLLLFNLTNPELKRFPGKPRRNLRTSVFREMGKQFSWQTSLETCTGESARSLNSIVLDPCMQLSSIPRRREVCRNHWGINFKQQAEAEAEEDGRRNAASRPRLSPDRCLTHKRREVHHHG